MSREIVEESSRPLLSQRFARSPLAVAFLQFVNAQFLKVTAKTKFANAPKICAEVGFKPEELDLYSLYVFDVPVSSRVQIAEVTHVASKIQNYLRVMQAKFANARKIYEAVIKVASNQRVCFRHTNTSRRLC